MALISDCSKIIAIISDLSSLVKWLLLFQIVELNTFEENTSYEIMSYENMSYKNKSYENMS